MCDHNHKIINREILKHGGYHCLRLCRKWEKLAESIIRFKQHVKFNSTCLKYKVFTKHCKTIIYDNNPRSRKDADEFSMKLVKNRLAHVKKSLFFMKRDHYKLITELYKHLPNNLIDKVKCRANINIARAKLLTKKKHHVKLFELFRKFKIDNSRNINLRNICDNWVVNLSSKYLNSDEISVLKLGPKFQLAPKFVNKEKIIAHVESKLKFILNDQPKLENIRNSISHELDKKYNYKPNLNNRQIKALKNLRNYKDIIITNSDKGNKVVIIDKIKYNEKVSLILSDTTVYNEIPKDDTTLIAQNLIKIISDLRKKGKISQNEYSNIYPGNYFIPEIYALIKTHKNDNPARLILPYFESPLYKISIYLCDLITPCLRNNSFCLKNTSQIIDDVKLLSIYRNDALISLDIVNLFTNIPLKYTLGLIKEKLLNDNDLANRTKLDIENILVLIEFCMLNNSFTYNGKFYKQITGTPMGSNLSPIIANTLVGEIFKNTIETFNGHIKFCRYFVDDSLIILNKNYIDSFYNHINNIVSPLKTIKFTIEKEQDNSINFLDIKLTKQNGSLSCSVYRKPTNSGRYLDYYSNHSLQIKKACIKTMVNRAFKYSTNENDRKNELNYLRDIFKINNYPEKLIEFCIRSCENKFYQPDNFNKVDFDPFNAISIPFYDGLSLNLKDFLSKFGINTVYKKGTTIQNILFKRKNRNILDKTHVVYRIHCKNCNFIYIGQTYKKLGIRIKQHEGALRNNYPNRSNVAKHAIDFKHTIDFENPTIAFVETNYRTRLILESLEIEKCKMNNVELMNDKQNSKTCIPRQYLSIYCK